MLIQQLSDSALGIRAILLHMAVLVEQDVLELLLIENRQGIASKGKMDDAANPEYGDAVAACPKEYRRLLFMVKYLVGQRIERGIIGSDSAREKDEAPLIIICDEITDPHNLGAIIRTAECAGAHGVIIPKRRSSGLTAVVAKASAGAMEYMKIARVSNLTAAIKTLKENGVWIYGTAADGAAPLYHTDLTGPTAIVIGSEGEGMGRLVSESCDFMVSIPMKGHINSLNASNACAILLYEAVRQRIN